MASLLALLGAALCFFIADRSIKYNAKQRAEGKPTIEEQARIKPVKGRSLFHRNIPWL